MAKDTIAVLTEEHFDGTEFRRFNEFFPAHGYKVEYLTHLWGQPQLRFGANPEDDAIQEHVVVTRELADVRAADYAGVILIGGYAMDRLRYQTVVRPGTRNQAPAVVFVRQAMHDGVLLGTICHSLWLLCADPDLIRGRKVTCAHNIVCDVENAGGVVVYDGDGTAELVVDGNLVSGKHPGTVAAFMQAFLEQLELRTNK